MGGQSSQSQSFQSQSAPWAPAQPVLQSILGSLQGMTGTIPLTGTESGAINTLEQNAQAGNPFSPAITNTTNLLLSGGGATSQNPALQQNLQSFQDRLGPFADPNYSSLNSPQLQAALDQIKSDTMNSVSGMYQSAGRDPAGAGNFGQTVGRGVAQGEAPLILNQFNQDQALKQNAANMLYGAGNTTASAIAGNNQQSVANQLQGVATAPEALSAQNYTPQQLLQFEQLAKTLPAQQAGLLAQIGIPIASLGGQTSGTSNTTSQMSGAAQFATILQGIGNLMPKNPMSLSF